MASLDRNPTTARDSKYGQPRFYVKLTWQNINLGVYGNKSNVFVFVSEFN
jgi:hypothetical protein